MVPVRFVYCLFLATFAWLMSGVSSKCDDGGGNDLLLAKGVISPEKTNLVFQIGPRLIGSKVDLDLVIENKTGFDLQLRFKASCGCTSVSDKLSVVKKDESFSLKPSVILPPKPESFSVVVTAYDQRLDLVYKFAITGNASEPFQVEPKIIHLVPNGSQSINLKIVELFPTEAIKDFSLVPTGVVVGSRALSRDSLEVTLDPAFVPIQTVSESFFMEINGVSGSKTRISIPVRIAGRKSITPNVVSLRRSGSKLTYFFVLSGFEDDLSASDLTVSVVGLGGLQLRGSIDSLKKRAVGTYSVGGSIDGLNGVDVLEAASSKILRVEDTKRNWVQEVKLLVY